jgi:DNA-directed RNA polymerase specialized sigma24 family protein
MTAMDSGEYTFSHIPWKARPFDLTPEAFNTLLRFLDSDRDAAGRKYEAIRRRLMTIFTCRGVTQPEELADETLNRVASKISEIAATYVGDPALYFYGVSRKVLLEWMKKRPIPAALPTLPSSEERELEFDCLEKCLEKLTSRNRDLILEYYRDEGTGKIEHRKALASRLGIGLNALRIRACRIRSHTEACVADCLDHNRTED